MERECNIDPISHYYVLAGLCGPPRPFSPKPSFRYVSSGRERGRSPDME